MRHAEMLLIVTAVLFKQQLMVRGQTLPPASLDAFNRLSGAESKLGEVTGTMAVKSFRSLSEGLFKQIDKFPFQVCLKSNRATA